MSVAQNKFYMSMGRGLVFSGIYLSRAIVG